MENYLSNLEPWYVTGLVEGEGTFTYQTSYQGRREIIFGVKLTASGRKLLEALRDFFGVGKIYNVKPIAPKKNSGRIKSAVYYKVFSLKNLERVVEHFDQFPLRGEKLRRYLIWREMVFLKKKNHRKRRIPEKDKEKIEELVRALSALASKNIPWDGDITSSNPQ